MNASVKKYILAGICITSLTLQLPAQALDDDDICAPNLSGASVLKKDEIDLEKILSSLKLESFTSLYRVFETLESAAQEATLKGKHTDAAQLWEGVTLYADAIVDPSSIYYKSYGIILDVGAVFAAETSKQKQIRDRKEMGFREAGKSYFRAQNYRRTEEMLVRLKDHRVKKGLKNLNLTIDEAKLAAEASQFEHNSRNEIHYRRLVACDPSSTNNDTLYLIERLWELKSWPDAPNTCWMFMKRTRDSDPEAYVKACELFEKYDPELLKHAINNEKTKNVEE
ncbi:MAG: hypothetical protein JSR85_00035 [Proteobacteria bacterium]|nr:hypothetical protein [Pseudomonadota bacterium]